MEVNLDTERLQDMMNILQEANNSIDSAAEKLLSITTHNGWACKERYTINDYVLENRNLAKTLQSDCTRFCRAAKGVADDFVETESGISHMFSSVEGALAQILANPVGAVVINPPAIGTAISSSIKWTGIGAKVPDIKSTKITKQWVKAVGIGVCPDRLRSVTSIVNMDNLDLGGN